VKSSPRARVTSKKPFTECRRRSAQRRRVEPANFKPRRVPNRELPRGYNQRSHYRGVKTSVKDHILVYFTTDGQVVVILKGGGKKHLSKTELGLYTVDGDEFVIAESEEHIVEGVCAEPGRYKWYYDGKVLVFTKVKDECEGRARALTSGPLSPFSQEK